MKIINYLLFLFILLFSSCNNTTSNNEKYDAELAKKLGADDYGMKNYTLVILKTGPAEITDPQVRDSLFSGHFENINKMSQSGKLVVAGPFGDNAYSYRGIFILDTESEEEAIQLLEDDPTISSGIFTVEIIPWYGSAALGEYVKIHKQIQKEEI